MAETLELSYLGPRFVSTHVERVPISDVIKCQAMERNEEGSRRRGSDKKLLNQA